MFATPLTLTADSVSAPAEFAKRYCARYCARYCTLAVAGVVMVLAMASSSHATDCDASMSPHFFSSPAACGSITGKLGSLFSDDAFSWLEDIAPAGNYPIHMPYEAENIYYYNRPYQFAQSSAGEVSPEESTLEASRRFREKMESYYRRTVALRRPQVGDVDAFEFSALPETER